MQKVRFIIVVFPLRSINVCGRTIPRDFGRARPNSVWIRRWNGTITHSARICTTNEGRQWWSRQKLPRCFEVRKMWTFAESSIWSQCRARNPVPSAIATNNLVVIRKDRDLLDSLKKLKSLEGSGILTKMSFQQQRAVHYNKALVLCLLNKVIPIPSISIWRVHCSIPSLKSVLNASKNWLNVLLIQMTFLEYWCH